MKSLIKRLINTVLTLFFLLLLSCATPGPIQQYTPGRVIDMGGYSLTGPPGDGWSVEKGEAVISFSKRSLPSGYDQIMIMAVRNDFKENEGRYLTEEEVTFNLINRVEERQKENVKKGDCVLNDIQKGTTMIGDKKLYFISTRTSNWRGGTARRADILYVFFPPDFKEKHGLFNFLLIQLSNVEGSLESVDLKLITPVIDSLKIKPQIEAKSKDAQFYFNRGTTYIAKGQYDMAISDYDKAIEINPRYAEAYFNRGNAYDGKGQYDQAISDYNKALEINPRFAQVYYNRGLTHSNKGQNDQAISDYTKALEINPRYAAAYINRGICYLGKGQLI